MEDRKVLPITIQLTRYLSYFYKFIKPYNVHILRFLIKTVRPLVLTVEFATTILEFEYISTMTEVMNSTSKIIILIYQIMSVLL